MPFERLKAAARTLRFQLLAWNTLVVLLMGIPTLLIVREGLRQALLHEFDQILLEDVLEIGLAYKQFLPRLEPLYGELERKAQGHAHHDWFVQFLDEQGELLWSSRDAPELDMPLHFTGQRLLFHHASYRLVQSRLEQPGRPPVYVRVGSSMRSVEEDVALLTRMMVLAAALLLLIAPLGGYWLAGRATRPIAQIIHTAANLRPSKLDERLPIRGAGDELDQLSSTINGLLDRIAAYIDQKRDFIANAAHELRSPLAAVESSVEVALNAERTREEYAALLADVLESCSSLRRLVNQLLLLAESDADRLALTGRTTRLDEAVRRAAAMFEAAAEAQGVTLLLDEIAAARVPGDDAHLRQVVNNLLDNAIKFTPPGGEVHAAVLADPVAGTARLIVRDDGPGVPPEHLPRIFERFYRVDAARDRTAERSGSGLGLSICQAVCEALGGAIAARNLPGRGAEFTVRLPLVVGAERPRNPADAVAHTPSP